MVCSSFCLDVLIRNRCQSAIRRRCTHARQCVWASRVCFPLFRCVLVCPFLLSSPLSISPLLVRLLFFSLFCLFVVASVVHFSRRVCRLSLLVLRFSLSLLASGFRLTTSPELHRWTISISACFHVGCGSTGAERGTSVL